MTICVQRNTEGGRKEVRTQTKAEGVGGEAEKCGDGGEESQEQGGGRKEEKYHSLRRK